MKLTEMLNEREVLLAEVADALDAYVVAQNALKEVWTINGNKAPTSPEMIARLDEAQEERDQASTVLDKLIDAHMIDFTAKAIRAGAQIDTVPCRNCSMEVSPDAAECWHCKTAIEPATSTKPEGGAAW